MRVPQPSIRRIVNNPDLILSYCVFCDLLNGRKMKVILRKNKEKYLTRGYPWVFSNIIDAVEDNPGTGDIVDISDASGSHLGCGLYNATSAIAVRFLSHRRAADVSDDLFRERVRDAISFRDQTMPGLTHRRLIYGESDGLPGLVIDQYGDVITWSCLSAGMEMRRDILLDELRTLIRPSAVVERNDVQLRVKDGLEERTGVIEGTLPTPVRIEEDGVSFDVDILNGPKTGFFIDQRPNRLASRTLARGRSVLDPFCADGGFGLHAAYAGAARVLMGDISAAAVERATHNAEINNLQAVTQIERRNALDWLGLLAEADERFDMIILDPPAFAKSKRNLDDATRSYQRLNITALQILEPGGILATSSCSQALSETDFLKIVHYSARKADRRLRLLHRGAGSPDHPVLSSMPDTDYLKFYIFQIVGDHCP